MATVYYSYNTTNLYLSNSDLSADETYGTNKGYTCGSDYRTQKINNLINNLKTCTYIEILNKISPDSTASFFSNFIKVEKIINLTNIDTSNVTSMQGMFSNCYSIKYLNLSSFDTSKVTSMYEMFYGCYNLSHIIVKDFLTYNVTNSNYMFYDCKSISGAMKYNPNIVDINAANYTGGYFTKGTASIRTIARKNEVIYPQTSTDAVYDSNGKTLSNILKNKQDKLVAGYGITIFSDNTISTVSPTCYGFHINGSESDPSSMVTYLEDAAGKTPAYMDYANSVFNWGSWSKDDFFMPRPCMVKYDGTVDYYLDPSDYTKKEDGTESDVANPDYEGNAMMEWGRDRKKIWTKVVPDEDSQNSVSVYIASGKLDDDYHAYSFINANGDLVDHFYTPIYNGSLISYKLRSISGQTVTQSNKVSDELTYAKNNGTGWNIEVFGDVLLINYLLILISKTTDHQTAFGYGRCGYSSSSSNVANTGLMNDKGMFYGQNIYDGTEIGVKVFGMEHWYGNIQRRIAGLTYYNGIRYKLCYGQEDGSGTDTYDVYGDRYIITGIVPQGYSGGSITKEVYFKNGVMLPSVLGGSNTTYYCDQFDKNMDYHDYAARGGFWSSRLSAGSFYLNLASTVSTAALSISSALSFKPLS